MDRKERAANLTESVIAALQGHQADMWTALPGIIQSFNPLEMTCSVQPAIQAKITDKTGDYQFVNLPLLVDCPVLFPGGGNYLISFPISNGDECLVVFSSRCIDSWWQEGGIQSQHQLRMHDLSDGFVIPKLYSLKKIPTNINSSFLQIRNVSNDVVITLDGTGQTITMDCPNGLIINGDVQINGQVNASGDVFGNGTSLHTHVHSGVQAGGSNTGQPV